MKKSFFYIITKHILLSVSIALALSIFTISITLGSLYYLAHTVYKDKVLPHTYVNDRDVSGLTRKKVAENLAKEAAQLNKNSITFIYSDKEQKTFTGSDFNFRYSLDKVEGLSLTSIPTEAQRLYTVFSHVVLRKPRIITIKPLYSSATLEEYLDQLDEDYGTEAKDAKFELKGSKVVAFQIEQVGTKVNREKALSDLEGTLDVKNEKIDIHLENEYDKPLVQIRDINTYGITEKIAEGVSDYRGSSNERIHNLLRAADQLHGVLIPQGATFSYNKAVGDISVQTGYKQAYIIQDGKTILGDGGGICQTSTTMFRAALNAGVPIIERHAHSYRVKYYENDQKPGLDATVFAPRVDFRFKNDTPAALLIQTRVDREKKKLTFEFYGTKDGRTATISPIRVTGYRPAPEPKYVDDPTLPRGTQKQVEFPAPGTKSMFDYLVTRNGETLVKETFVSNYRPWQAVFLVGTRD